MNRPRFIPMKTWNPLLWIHVICNSIAVILSFIKIGRGDPEEYKTFNMILDWIMICGAIPSLTLRYYTGTLNWTHMASVMVIIVGTFDLVLGTKEMHKLTDMTFYMSLLVGGSGGLVRHTNLDRIISWQILSWTLGFIMGPLVYFRIAYQYRD